ncbi:MAG: hypothetical protein AAF355_02070 [Myxococcota bacterium]
MGDAGSPYFGDSRAAYTFGNANFDEIVHLPHSAVTALANLSIGNQSCVPGHEPLQTPLGFFASKASPVREETWGGSPHFWLTIAAILAGYVMCVRWSERGRGSDREAHAPMPNIGGDPRVIQRAADAKWIHDKAVTLPRRPSARVEKCEHQLRVIIAAGMPRVSPESVRTEDELVEQLCEWSKTLNEKSPQGDWLGLNNIAEHIRRGSAYRILEQETVAGYVPELWTLVPLGTSGTPSDDERRDFDKALLEETREIAKAIEDLDARPHGTYASTGLGMRQCVHLLAGSRTEFVPFLFFKIEGAIYFAECDSYKGRLTQKSAWSAQDRYQLRPSFYRVTRDLHSVLISIVRSALNPRYPSSAAAQLRGSEGRYPGHFLESCQGLVERVDSQFTAERNAVSKPFPMSVPDPLQAVFQALRVQGALGLTPLTLPGWDLG